MSNSVYRIIFYNGGFPDNPIGMGFDSSFSYIFDIFSDMVEAGANLEFDTNFFSLELQKYDLDTREEEIILLISMELKEGEWRPVRRTYLEQEIDRFFIEAADEDFDNLEEYDEFFMKFHNE